MGAIPDSGEGELDEIFDTLPVHNITASDGITDSYWDSVNARIKLKQAIKALIAASNQQAVQKALIEELESQLSNFVGKQYYKDPVKKLEERIAALAAAQPRKDGDE